jgi:hypothetical protein
MEKDNLEMDEQEIPRNSSLIAHKHAFNITYEKIEDDDSNEKCVLKKRIDLGFEKDNDFLLDSKFIPVYDNDSDLLFNRKIILNDSIQSENSNENAKSSHKRKNQKRITNEFKRCSGPMDLPADIETFRAHNLKRRSVELELNASLMPNEIDSILPGESFDESIILFDNSACEKPDSIANLSPIAHELSEINGKELKDVSNIFPCDISLLYDDLLYDA